MTPAVSVDPLRERLLAAELQRARTLLQTHGVQRLLERAAACVTAARAARSRATTPGTSEADFALHSERAARDLLAREQEAEACLLVARAALPGRFDDSQLAELLLLASSPGRWSRQVQALVLLRDAASRLESEQRARVCRSLEALALATAPRWVQAPALDVLAAYAPARALELAEARLSGDAGGEDFIPRSRIAELCAKHHKRGWQALLRAAHADPSELVRQSVARATHGRPELERLASSDSSHRVRALALIKLRRRFKLASVPLLSRALTTDPHAFVVETAARELVLLLQLYPSSASLAHVEPLAVAAEREALATPTRALCRELATEARLLAEGGAQLLSSLRETALATPPGGTSDALDSVVAQATQEQLGRALAVLTRDDFGLGLTRTTRGFRLHRGERSGFAIWRLLYELFHPGSSKRQAFRHTLARRGEGELRAHPRSMAEVTATSVPGERVLIAEQGDWGRQLPLVEDLLALGWAKASELRLASARGITLVSGPATFGGCVRAKLQIWRRYAELAHLRERSLASSEPHVQAAYARAVEQLGITLRLGSSAGMGQVPQLPSREAPRSATGGAALVLAPLLRVSGESGSETPLGTLWSELSNYAASPGTNRLSHLAIFATIMLGAMTVRAVGVRRAVRRDRDAIPLVIGGWGTRGKSGTERLKAALFQGLGYETLVKTTGCEAMFIHAIPGVPAHEVFIYRPYDKATVWEQRDVLGLARRFGVKVFLWECMALQPDLVDLLQAQWMRDDYSTITNTYPDHEDVQGPSGFDVASTISQFVPHAGRLFTTEEQMLPLLREQARLRGSRIATVETRDAELISDELRSRFGHDEHPRNLSLVLRLARSLGIPATIALTEMADHVVPDLGVLKTYGPLTWLGRELSFTNGMGANDRAGTLGNWQRAGFAAAVADEPARWLVTVVNNRADRVARSEVFAKLIVEDIGAHRHVLIGTNVAGLQGLIQRALAAHLAASGLRKDLPKETAAHKRVASERVKRALSRLMLVDLGARAALAEAALSARTDLLPMIEPLLIPAASGEAYADALRVVAAGVAGCAERESEPFLARAVARRRTAAGLLQAVEELFDREPERVEQFFRDTYSALFQDSIIAFADHKLTGDALLSLIAASLPPGARGALIGLQNIKGTGLDFVYRWLSIDAVQRLLAELERASGAGRHEVLTKLLAHGDYGLLDASTALERVRALDPGTTAAERALHAAVVERLTQIVAQRSATNAKTQGTLGRYLARTLRASFDFIDSVLRRRRADQIVSQLVSGELSHPAAAREMRVLVARGKARDA